MFFLPYAIGYSLPVIILAIAAAVGVFSARYFKGHPSSADMSGETRLIMAIWLAVAFPVVGIAALVVPTFLEIQKLYGPIVDLLWLWALLCLGIGVAFGWSSCEHAVKRT